MASTEGAAALICFSVPRQLIEKTVEHKETMYITFVNLRKATTVCLGKPCGRLCGNMASLQKW